MAKKADGTRTTESYDLIVVSNRLPVDRVVAADGSESWGISPGGLVSALEPVMRRAGGAWIGWAGVPGAEVEPFEHGGVQLIPLPLSEQDVELYYEGFSNDTIWPLYHDVIAPPAYHREWWEAYQSVNARFAQRAIEAAAPGATVWVQDYQLQLVPRMIRDARPDLLIGYFHHIPFPGYGLWSQLPWRGQIMDGLLGADVIGFQRSGDVSNFRRSIRRLRGYDTRGRWLRVPEGEGGARRPVLVDRFPISIDAAEAERLAREPSVRARAREIREQLGDPRTIMLGVDRLDYTKGIPHRLKAFRELLEDGRLSGEDVALIQIASPSRERVATYRQLRDEVELVVGRINGEHSTFGRPVVEYLYQNEPREEMAALYLAADVLLVTALRDGMNLVAKEYVASRFDNTGTLVLSEFTGAADELRQAVLVNPHDIDGLKDAIVRAVEMPRREQERRMRRMRRLVAEHDVAAWAQSFFDALEEARTLRGSTAS